MHKNFLFLLALLIPLAGAGRGDRVTAFEPGKAWVDTDGNRIQAHGGGMLERNGTYYWFGEDMSAPTDAKTQNVALTGVSCYSSRDLLNWKNEGLALRAVKDDPAHDLAPANAAERPKVIYNRRTGKYVMWLHIDRSVLTKQGWFGYEYARAAVAVADKPAGPYRYLGSMRPDGQESRDMTVFQDRDGKAYLIFSSQGNRTMHISLLTDDYLKPSGKSAEAFVDQYREAPAMFRAGDRYFLITSKCTGWKPNQALYAVARSPLGPWEVKGNPCTGPDAELTFHSQSTYVLPVPGRRDAFIFLADRWNPLDLGDTRDVWLPLIVSGERIEIPWAERWDFTFFDRLKRP